jgi:hypothetical protein
MHTCNNNDDHQYGAQLEEEGGMHSIKLGKGQNR